MRRLAALLLLATTPTLGQSTGSISGTIIDSVTGTPIRRAQVHLNGNLAITDASGSFVFEQVAPGSYSVSAQHQDYPPRRLGDFSQVSVTVGPGEQKRGLEFKLTPAAAISGRISDDDGDPLANCNLSLLTRNGQFLISAANTTSNQNGEYLFELVPAAKYYVEAQCRAPHLQPRPFATPEAVLPGPQLGYGFRYYPAASNFSGAQRLTVIPGQTLRGVDIRMVPETMSALVVRVTGLTADLSRLLMVCLTPDDGGPALPGNRRSAPVQPRTGVVRIVSVPPGKYTLRVTTRSGQMTVAKQPVQIGEATSEVTVQVVPPVPITGTILVDHADGAPRQQGTISLVQIEDGREIKTPSKADGSFAFLALSPGRYLASVSGGLFVKSILSGGDSFDGAEFELKPGAAGPMEVHVTNEPGTLSGDVATSPAHPTRFNIITTMPSTQSRVSDFSGDAPHFSVHIAPGHYRVYAVEQTQEKDPFAFLADATLATRGESIDIRAGSETVKNLKLITAEEIEKADP